MHRGQKRIKRDNASRCRRVFVSSNSGGVVWFTAAVLWFSIDFPEEKGGMRARRYMVMVQWTWLWHHGLLACQGVVLHIPF